MSAETLNCPMCGAAASTDATRCEHCGARLATVACPSCFGMMFVGDKFCPHCGAAAARAEVPDGKPELCPRCNVEMPEVAIGKCSVHECSRCEGIWVDSETLQQICADREKQAAVLGVATTVPTPSNLEIEEHVHYLRCPICQEMMNRVNFAHCSHVIVNVCGRHGTWFDKNQLRQIIEFIRGGGMDVERARQIEELKSEQSKLDRGKSNFTPSVGSWPAPDYSTVKDYDLLGSAISLAARFLVDLIVK